MVEERDYEAEARKEGWVPQDEWKGPEDKWKPAQQFVEDGEKINPILRKKVDNLESRINELLESNKKLNEFTQRSIDKEKKEKAELVKQLEAARKQAVTDGDGEAFAQADAKLQSLRESEPPQKEELSPVAQRWLNDNNWYNTDPVLGPYADGIADRLVMQGYTPGSEAYFKELTVRVHDAFPDKFENPKRSKPNGVEHEGSKTVASNARTFANLPPDAKKQYEIFKRDIPGFTKEQYVEHYDWETE